MGTIVPVGEGFRARVRMQGRNLSKNFDTRPEALAWVKRTEAEIHLSQDQERPVGGTFGEWLLRYIEEVADRHQTAKDKKSRLRRLMKMDIARARVGTLTPGHFEKLKAKLSGSGLSPQTVRHYLQDCSAVWQAARKEWKVTHLANPLRDTDIPPVSQGRKKRVSQDLWDKILPALQRHVNPFYAPFAEFLLETAMRVHEPLLLRAGDIDAQHHVLTVVGKGGEQRTVPLTPRALQILEGMVKLRRELPKSFSAPNGGTYDLTGYDDDIVWPISYRGFARAWSDARSLAGDDSVWIHDIRRERATRLIEGGVDLATVSVVTGHKSLRTLREHYTVVEAQQVAARLAQLQEREGRPLRLAGENNSPVRSSK